mgnify:FL=1
MNIMTKEEGFFALYRGFQVALVRQAVFAGIRISLYVPVRNAIGGELKPGENTSILTKIMAGMICGAIGITVANPLEVAKVRLQA